MLENVLIINIQAKCNVKIWNIIPMFNVKTLLQQAWVAQIGLYHTCERNVLIHSLINIPLKRSCKRSCVILSNHYIIFHPEHHLRHIPQYFIHIIPWRTVNLCNCNRETFNTRPFAWQRGPYSYIFNEKKFCMARGPVAQW